jgi:uncharacterized protein (DUF2384 family)
MQKAIKKYSTPKSKPMIAKEPTVEYSISKKPVTATIAGFSFKKFQRIADKVPFTQKEWADILHLSERTLQRYAKSNTSFEGIYVDRILQMEQLIEMGLETFINSKALYDWLKKEKYILGEILNFSSLYSLQGINSIINQLGRIQYGVYI